MLAVIVARLLMLTLLGVDSGDAERFGTSFAWRFWLMKRIRKIVLKRARLKFIRTRMLLIGVSCLVAGIWRTAVRRIVVVCVWGKSVAKVNLRTNSTTIKIWSKPVLCFAKIHYGNYIVWLPFFFFCGCTITLWTSSPTALLRAVVVVPSPSHSASISHILNYCSLFWSLKCLIMIIKE